MSETTLDTVMRQAGGRIVAALAAHFRDLDVAEEAFAEAGVPFEVPGPELWTERLQAVFSTLEVAYAKAHEDAAGTGPRAGYATEMLELTRVLHEMLPEESDALALAALVRYAEARRPARLAAKGMMIPLSEQATAQCRRPLW